MPEQGRNLETTKDLELEVLQLVKAKHDLEADLTLEQWLSGKKGRKPKAAIDTQVDNLWDESDDECAAHL